jgi:hypothetical protein
MSVRGNPGRAEGECRKGEDNPPDYEWNNFSATSQRANFGTFVTKSTRNKILDPESSSE